MHCNLKHHNIVNMVNMKLDSFLLILTTRVKVRACNNYNQILIQKINN